MKSNNFDTCTDTNLSFKRNNVDYITFNQATDDITFHKHPTVPRVNVGTADYNLNLITNASFELFDISNNSTTVDKTQVIRLVINNNSIAEAKADGLFCYSAGLKTDIIDTATNTDLLFRRGGIEFMKFETTLGQVEMTAGVKSNTYDSIGNADVAFRRNFVDFFYLRNGEVEMNGTTAISTQNAKIDTINTKGNNVLTFQRNSTNVMKVNASNQLQFLQGAEKCFIYEEAFFDLFNFNVFRIRNTENVDAAYISFGVGDVLDVLQVFKTNVKSSVFIDAPSFVSNTYNSSGNFQRDSVNYLHLRNNFVEVDSSASLWSANARIDTIITTGNDMVFQRNGVEFLRFDGPNTVTNGPENLLLVNDGNVGISSSWLFANTFANRTSNTDTEFRGAVPAGLASGIVYMKYEHAIQNLRLLTDVEMVQPRGFFLHRETGKGNYLYSQNVSGVNHAHFNNDDPNGEIRLSTNGSVKMYLRTNDIQLGSGVILNGDVNDTSDKTKNMISKMPSMTLLTL